jgi:hypothetical protein
MFHRKGCAIALAEAIRHCRVIRFKYGGRKFQVNPKSRAAIRLGARSMT